MWKTLEFIYFNHFALAKDLSQKLLHLELRSNNFLLALTETNKLTFEMTGRNSESVIGDAASWNVLNGYIIGREDVRSTLTLTMISDENENQFLMFLIFIYLIDPDSITLYRKKNFEILTGMRF